MEMDYKNDEEMLEAFINEAGDHLQEIEAGLLRLEHCDDRFDDDLIHAIFW